MLPIKSTSSRDREDQKLHFCSCSPGGGADLFQFCILDICGYLLHSEAAFVDLHCHEQGSLWHDLKKILIVNLNWVYTLPLID